MTLHRRDGEKPVDRSSRKDRFIACLRGAWDAGLQAMSALERSPVEDLLARVERLESEMAATRERGTGGQEDGAGSRLN
jgi:hypothetical protein